MHRFFSRFEGFCFVPALLSVLTCLPSLGTDSATVPDSIVAESQSSDCEKIALCAACGRELPPAARFCPHCGESVAQKSHTAAAPESTNQAAPGAIPSPAPESTVATEAATSAPFDDCAAIFAEYKDSNPAVALFALREAQSVLRGQGQSSDGERRLRSLAETEKRLFDALDHVNAACKSCSGTGILKDSATRKNTGDGGRKSGGGFVSLEDVAVGPREKASASSGGVKCPVCGGSGAASRVRDRKSLKSLLALGKRDFDAAADSRPALSAWRRSQAEAAGNAIATSPADSQRDAQSSRRHSHSTADAETRECQTCAGTGSLPCRACSGFGKILCPDKAFHQSAAASGGAAATLARPSAAKSGSFTSIEQTQLRPHGQDSAVASDSRCPLCGGRAGSPAGAARCPACGGSGYEACGSCGGSGEKKGRRNG